MNKLTGLILWGVLSALSAYARPSDTAHVARPAPVYNEYLTINEKTQAEPDSRKRTAENAFDYSAEFAVEQFVTTVKKVISLLNWHLHNLKRPVPDEAYIRKLHFGRWINDPTDDTCMNTRAKVLVRDSAEEVTYRGNKQCVVDMGRWTDPYSGIETTDSREIQIDHMVPLKHAYMAGAWKWDYKTRCLYANYLGYKDHLIPATVHENTSKGDRGPEQYMPPELSYRCEYVKNWLMIKLIWGLNMTMDEAQTIHETVTNYGCDAGRFKVTKDELSKQRQYIQDNLEFCMINKR
ncbi:DUF1524 domain-containing protein [Bdellovibrio bacteriovorus]